MRSGVKLRQFEVFTEPTTIAEKRQNARPQMKFGCTCCSIVFGNHVRVAGPSSESLAGALVDHQLRRGSVQKGAQAVHGEEVVEVTGRCEDSLEKTLLSSPDAAPMLPFTMIGTRKSACSALYPICAAYAERARNQIPAQSSKLIPERQAQNDKSATVRRFFFDFCFQLVPCNASAVSFREPGFNRCRQLHPSPSF